MNEEYLRCICCLDRGEKKSCLTHFQIEESKESLPEIAWAASCFWVCHGEGRCTRGCRCTMQMYKNKTYTTEIELGSSQLQKFQELRQTTPWELLFQQRSLFNELEEAKIKQPPPPPPRSSSKVSFAYTALAEVQTCWCSAQWEERRALSAQLWFLWVGSPDFERGELHSLSGTKQRIKCCLG